jgi:hypothetical protein
VIALLILPRLVLGRPLPVHDGSVLELSIGKAAEATKAVADDAGARSDVGPAQALMASLVSPGRTATECRPACSCAWRRR